VKVVMTMVVRDEADIVESQIAFHLAAGVDFFVVTDHESRDGTTAILERYAADGVLYLLRECGAVFQQSEWVTRMARMAATELGADWVINSDADEFWWPTGGNLKDVLSAIPARIGIVQTFVRPFLPPAVEGFFARRMTVRLSPLAPINDPASPFRVNVRLLHRGIADVVVGSGNATVRSASLGAPCDWSPVDVLHFPIRGLRHFERKFLSHHGTVSQRPRGDHARAWRAAQEGRLREVYGEMSVAAERVNRGSGGALTIDTRLRDALEQLAADPATELGFPQRDAVAEAQYAAERAVLREGELVRLQRSVDQLDRRFRARSSEDRHEDAA
jgi:Glycosyl transferase family 2